GQGHAENSQLVKMPGGEGGHAKGQAQHEKQRAEQEQKQYSPACVELPGRRSQLRQLEGEVFPQSRNHAAFPPANLFHQVRVSLLAAAASRKEHAHMVAQLTELLETVEV